MMRILFLTSLYSTPLQPARGLPNARIARGMRRFADVRVIAPLPYYPTALVKNRPDLLAVTKVPFAERDEDDQIVLHPRYVHVPRFGRALYPSLYAASIARVVSNEVKTYKPDVILSAWAYPDGVAAISLAKLLGVPSVLRVMGSDINAFGLERFRRPQIQWVLRNATRVISVSHALRGACVDLAGSSKEGAWSGDNIDVIPTGVDTTRFFPVDRAQARAELGLPKDKRVIVVPARLSVEKGVSYFVEALASLPDDCVGVLVGDGPERAALESQARRLSLQDRVIFAGHQTEKHMKLYYSAADLVCLPSTEEGWPNVLMESFACGCPWVASNVGGVPELLAIAPGGILAAPREPVDLANALQNGLARSWDRKKIAECAALQSLDATASRYVESCEAARGDRPNGSASGSPTRTSESPPRGQSDPLSSTAPG